MTDEETAEKYAKANMYYEIAKRENGADYAKEVSSVTIKQAFLAGLEYKNKENAELKEKISILLSCKNCPENKGDNMLLEQRILDLQKDKGALIDKVRELKNEVARLTNENEE